MKEKRKAIFYTVKGNYVQLMAASILSVILNIDSDYRLDIIVVSNDISVDNKNAISDLLNRTKNKVNILFISVPEKVVEASQGLSDIFPDAACWRIFMPFYLKEYDQVLYLDCDTLLYQGFEEIFSLIPDDKILGTVSDFYFYAINEKAPGSTKEDKTYFNSGVCLINVENYINKASLNEMIDALHDNKTLYIDQAFLNDFFKEDTKLLPFRFNYQKDDNWLYNWATDAAPKTTDLIRKERENIRIRHFIEFGPNSMPWQHISVNDQFEQDFWNIWTNLKISENKGE